LQGHSSNKSRRSAVTAACLYVCVHRRSCDNTGLGYRRPVIRQQDGAQLPVGRACKYDLKQLTVRQHLQLCLLNHNVARRLCCWCSISQTMTASRTSRIGTDWWSRAAAMASYQQSFSSRTNVSSCLLCG
jgi:hypothetical protein